MTLDELKSIHERRPFQPFTIHLAGGMRYDVPTPEFLSYRPGAGVLFVWDLRSPGYAFLSLPAVTRVTPADAPLAPAAGG